jgi:hypothetical protein
MQLSELATIRTGYPFRSRLTNDPQGDVVVIQMKDIDDANQLCAASALRTTLPKGKTRHFLKTGDLLFRSRGRSNEAALVNDDLGAAVLAAPMLLIRPHAVLPEYLCWYLNASATQARLGALAEGTSVKMISAEALKVLDIPLPPVSVQERIAQTHALAERERQLLANITELRQSLTTHLLMKSAHEAAR